EAERATAAHHPAGDLAAIGDQDLLHRLGQLSQGLIASRTARATATAPGVSEWTQMQSARIGMSGPCTDFTLPSRIARTVRAAAAAGSTASCSRVMISRPVSS